MLALFAQLVKFGSIENDYSLHHLLPPLHDAERAGAQHLVQDHPGFHMLKLAKIGPQGW